MKQLLISVLFVLILELTPQIVLIVQFISSMIKSMLIVNLVNQLTTDVLNVIQMVVKFVKQTEIYHTVTVVLVLLKLKENVSHVPIIVLPVLVPKKIVFLVLLQELIQTLVLVHMVIMITCQVPLNVHNVIRDVLDVNIKITIVLFVLPTELVFQIVLVLMVKLKMPKEIVSLVIFLVLPVLMLLNSVLIVLLQEY